MSKSFIDTNILIYAFDRSAGAKRQVARDTITQADDRGRAVISTQVLQEFYVCAIKKLAIAPLVAKELVEKLSRFELVSVGPDLIMRAIDCSILSQLSFWDALIVVSAEAARCDQLLTEDLNDGQIICGVQVENPFPSQDRGERVRERDALYSARVGL